MNNRKCLFKTPEQGSRSVVFAAIDPKIEGQGGTYISNCARGPMHRDARSPTKCENFFKFTCDMLNIENFESVKI